PRGPDELGDLEVEARHHRRSAGPGHDRARGHARQCRGSQTGRTPRPPIAGTPERSRCAPRVLPVGLRLRTRTRLSVRALRRLDAEVPADRIDQLSRHVTSARTVDPTVVAELAQKLRAA